MLANFFASSPLREQYEISFSYRESKEYTQGLNQRVSVDFPVYPLPFSDLSDPNMIPGHWPVLVKRAMMFCLRLLLTLPLLGHEIWVLRRIFLQVQAAVVHVNTGGFPPARSAKAAVIAARTAAVPQIVMVVNNQATDYVRPSRWMGYLLDRLIAHSVSCFVTGSAAAARQLRQVLRLREEKCHALHNGIALRQTTEVQDETRKRLGLDGFTGAVFGVVAILRPNKGHLVLLEAMALLLRASPDAAGNIKLLIEGSGPLLNDLQKFVIDNKLSDHCIFVGDEPNIMNFMAILDVLILPSVSHEDFPNVILEAMGHGKPVIASRLAGTPEQVVDGKTGILVEPKNAAQLALAIDKLRTDAQLREKMGLAGLQRFHDHFTAEVAVRNYLALYQSLTEI